MTNLCIYNAPFAELNSIMKLYTCVLINDKHSGNQSTHVLVVIECFCVQLVLGLGLCPKSGKSGASKALTGNWLLLPTAFD